MAEHKSPKISTRKLSYPHACRTAVGITISRAARTLGRHLADIADSRHNCVGFRPPAQSPLVNTPHMSPDCSTNRCYSVWSHSWRKHCLTIRDSAIKDSVSECPVTINETN